MIRKSKTTWSRTTKELPADAHLALKAILNCLASLQSQQDGKPVVRDAIVPALPDFLRALGVKTSQGATRILYYWRKLLVDEGYVTLGRLT